MGFIPSPPPPRGKDMGIEYIPEPVPRKKPVDACAQAKCSYCGRYGPLGQCQGCGASNNQVSPHIGGVLTWPGQVTAVQAQALRDAWFRAFAGNNTGKVAIL